jgi:hypothetical protein
MDVPAFVIAQLVGAGLATAVFGWLTKTTRRSAP